MPTYRNKEGKFHRDDDLPTIEWSDEVKNGGRMEIVIEMVICKLVFIKIKNLGIETQIFLQ